MTQIRNSMFFVSHSVDIDVQQIPNTIVSTMDTNNTIPSMPRMPTDHAIFKRKDDYSPAIVRVNAFEELMSIESEHTIDDCLGVIASKDFLKLGASWKGYRPTPLSGGHFMDMYSFREWHIDDLVSDQVDTLCELPRLDSELEVMRFCHGLVAYWEKEKCMDELRKCDPFFVLNEGDTVEGECPKVLPEVVRAIRMTIGFKRTDAGGAYLKFKNLLKCIEDNAKAFKKRLEDVAEYESEKKVLDEQHGDLVGLLSDLDDMIMRDRKRRRRLNPKA